MGKKAQQLMEESGCAQLLSLCRRNRQARVTSTGSPFGATGKRSKGKKNKPTEERGLKLRDAFKN